jgi:hypothetical protein
MNSRRSLACFAAFAALFVGAGPARAQSCDNAPGTRGQYDQPGLIDRAASEAFGTLRQERTQAEPLRGRTRAQRLAQFRILAAMHWRWTCDRRGGLANKPDVRAYVLIQGVLFFDLADDLPNMRNWYTEAKALITGLRHGTVLPPYLGQPLEVLLGIAGGRLASTERKLAGWYFTSNGKG